MIETAMIQKMNMGQDSMVVAPKNSPITRMPMPVEVARSTTVVRLPTTISRYDSGATSISSTKRMKREK